MGAPPTHHSVFDHRAGVDHVIIDPTQTYFMGHSLGSVQGAMDVAANPRFTKAVFNAPGGTAVDVFTNSPAFAKQVGELLAGLGVAPGTSQYLQFLVVAKTILDPAEPLNYAGHITSNTLPNLLPPLGGNPNGSVPQMPKKALAQVPFCDQVIPNPFEFLFASNMGASPLPLDPAFSSPTATGTLQIFLAALTTDLNACPFFGGAPLPPASVPHGFIQEWNEPSSPRNMALNLLTAGGQADAARFLVNDQLPSTVHLP
jgi:hypothetical protein